MSDIDSVDEESDYVLLMTLHSAKGLEFPNVFLAGMEDGIFPSYMTITGDDPSELEEERRLCYVGITRAMQHLTLTCARQRMIRGEVQYNKMSRFVKEIPRELISLERERGEIEDRKPKMDIPREAAAGENLQCAEGDETRLRNRGYGAPYQVRCRHCHGYRGRRKRL